MFLQNWDAPVLKFPLVQLPKKFKAAHIWNNRNGKKTFPLVQLPKKFKGHEQHDRDRGHERFH